MNNVEEFLRSGIIESWLLGQATDAEVKEIERMMAQYPEVKKEVEIVMENLLQFSAERAFTPNNTVKPLIVATVDYTERIKNGEQPADPPILGTHSKLSDYAEWLNRPDMVLPDDADEIFIKLIASTSRAISAIVWIKNETPPEKHATESERFLIAEGNCDIVISGKPHSLVPGDYMAIPLHAEHVVKVTSEIPCKVVLQRVTVTE